MDFNRTKIIGMLVSKGSLDIARRVYDIDFISPCLPAHASDTVPKILIKDNTNEKKIKDS